MQAIPKSTINFLKELKLNNNREWFNENKQEYQSIQIDVKKFTPIRINSNVIVQHSS